MSCPGLGKPQWCIFLPHSGLYGTGATWVLSWRTSVAPGLLHTMAYHTGMSA